LKEADEELIRKDKQLTRLEY